MTLILFLAFPFVCLVWAIKLWIQRKRSGLALSFLSAGLGAAIYTWSVFQSRSSTAVIGLIFAPLYASICGLLCWGYFYFRLKPGTLQKVARTTCLLVLLALIGYGAYAGLAEKERITEKDEDDEAFKLAMARHSIADSSALDSFANSKDLGLLAAVIYNPKTTSSTLDRIWSTQSNNFGLHYAFASNSHTSSKIY